MYLSALRGTNAGPSRHRAAPRALTRTETATVPFTHAFYRDHSCIYAEMRDSFARRGERDAERILLLSIDDLFLLNFMSRPKGPCLEGAKLHEE